MKSVIGIRSRFLWLIFLSSVIIGSIILGLLQFSWISQAAETEKYRYMNDITSGTARSIMNSLRDLRPVLPVIQEQVSERKNTVDYEKITDIMTVWNARAQDPGLIEELWIFENGGSFRIDTEALSFRQTSFEDYQDISLMLSTVPGKTEMYKMFRKLLPLGYLFVFPDEYHQFSIFHPLDSRDYKPLKHFALIKLNLELYLDSILPAALEEQITDLDYRIEKTGGGDPGTKNSKDEIRLPIPAPSIEIIYRRERYVESMLTPRPDPSFEGIPKEPAEFADDETEDHYPFHVHGYVIFTIEEGSLEAKFGKWVLINASVSAGLLLVLVASLITVFFMYRKTGQIRMLEREFAASMSHELRLPVTVIKAIADNLGSGMAIGPERTAEYGKEIHNEAVRLEKMVEGILLYSGLQSKKQQLYRKPVDIKALCKEIVQEVYALAGTEDMEITPVYNLPDRRLTADRQGLTIIIQNLLLNAATHSSSGEPGKKSVITMELSLPHSDRLRISVTDNGRGIPGTDLKRIFDPFFRTKDSINKQEPGSGLGLHLVKQIAKINDGTAALESPYRNGKGETVQGCRFTVEIKLGEA